MMARIEASERLLRISDGAASAGNMREMDFHNMHARLEEAKAGIRRERSKATPAVLAGMGIGVRVASPAPAETAVGDV